MSNVLKSVTTKAAGYDVMSDIRYIRKACSLVTDALKKRCDVLQMPSGDIVITEIRTVSFQYRWNEARNRFEKVKSGSRLRRMHRRKAAAYDEAALATEASNAAASGVIRSPRAKEKVLEDVAS